MIKTLTTLILFALSAAASAAPPNVVVILTDDQAFGDVGAHGNPVIKTPRLDALSRQSVQLTQFSANPLCSPTRASLLTGRYYYRTGVTDTYQGRAMMRPSEVTMAELFKGAGYRTALFGKWHLGDCYPMRPQDQGFHEVLTLRGGGLTQSADPPPGSHYQDPLLVHNGAEKAYKGYCTDVFTDEAINFIEKTTAAKRPFFTYLSYNAPHTPLEARDEDVTPYRALRLSPASFPHTGFPIMRPLSSDNLCKLYGMVTNIDTNVGKLLDALDRLKIADDTVVVFMSDNGPQEARFNAGLHGLKGSCFEGGLRVPCYIRQGNKLKPAVKDAPAAMIDLLPTLCTATGVVKPSDRVIDGKDLWSYLQGKSAPSERVLFFQWHRGDVPQKYRAFAARGPRYKLVQPDHTQEKPWSGATPFQLFDLLKDPFELTDLAASKTDELTKLKIAYEKWFDDVTKPGFKPTHIVLGTNNEPVTRLTRQDWRGAIDNQRGMWDVSIRTAGTFDLSVILPKDAKASKLHIKLGDVKATADPAPGATMVDIKGLKLPAGDGRLDAWFDGPTGPAGVWQIVVRRAG